MTTGLRTTFWLHAIVSFVFGIGYLFVPEFVTNLFNLEMGDPLTIQLFGAATLALCLSSVLAAISPNFERVDIILQTEAGFTLIALLACLYALIVADAPAMIWVAAGIFGIFLIGFGYYYIVTRSLAETQRGRPALR